MQSDANQCNTKFYNTSNSSEIDCKLMKLLEVYYTQNGVAVLLSLQLRQPRYKYIK